MEFLSPTQYVDAVISLLLNQFKFYLIVLKLGNVYWNYRKVLSCQETDHF